MISMLKRENSMLKRRPALYENPNTPSSRHKYPRRKCFNRSGKRYPGRPTGRPRRTRPRPRPEVVKPPPPKERCERCGSPLGEPCYVNHHIVEEVSNPSPKRVPTCNVNGVFSLSVFPGKSGNKCEKVCALGAQKELGLSNI